MTFNDLTGEPFVIVRLGCGYIWRMTVLSTRFSQTVNRDQFRKIALKAYGLKGNLSRTQLLPKR